MGRVTAPSRSESKTAEDAEDFDFFVLVGRRAVGGILSESCEVCLLLTSASSAVFTCFCFFFLPARGRFLLVEFSHGVGQPSRLQLAAARRTALPLRRSRVPGYLS